MLGFLNLDKPLGLSSHDCVARVRKQLCIKRVGHGGTLDPRASGVLPIAVGKATRLLPFLPEDKMYRARIRFGVRTTSDDLEGEVIETHPAANLNYASVEACLGQFLGRIEQIPPAFSAIQQGGKRLYELARQGETVEVPSRIVEVKSIEVLAWYPGTNPELEAAIACGGGTYIRAIARDLGKVLGVGGTLAALTRTRSGGFNLEDSITLEQLQDSAHLVSPGIALAHLPKVTLPFPLAKRWCQGQKLPLDRHLFGSEWLQVEAEDGRCLGVATLLERNQTPILVPKVVIATV